ncbi:mannose-P-dolichol utilization defect 1 protein-like protein [Dothidotthia symphoricarpi CBS 119687]|uniref:Mannose-P-dolichol utilization defect 1 protein homolog n=1 Tax=Dothidotthia symphoricarpi CBS 119687 TaxID=1392245 RepID=A0A6A6AJK7_9PLEO|nr:mannose-P-dolichol utilization defect 1 protein-like protein [Dothidotthia symphoricarpi CBS 119687]KAF2132129.1 mannose-P-dolichol utilization defect 1 protein-like protein [Dothidotthia symphoricarpi CBS 119687]
MDALRSALQPITHNLPKPIVDVGQSLLGPVCYKTLLHDIDISSTECVKLAVSKGLGIGIIGASSVVKVPQLLKLLNSQSAGGLSFLSYLLESSSYLISLGYNVRHGFPFSTYGETALILVQNIAIASLVLKYQGRGAAIAAWVGGLAVAGAAIFNENVVDEQRLSLLQATAGVLGVASKVPQILTIWSEGGTGQLSAFAVINYLLGSLSRIFTTLQEVPDPLILYGYIAGFALNAILFLQVLWYWNAPASKNTDSKKLHTSKPVAGDKKEMAQAISSGSIPSYANTAGKTPSTRRRG